MNTMTAPTKEGHLVLGSSEDALTVCVLDDEQGMVEMLPRVASVLGFSSVGTCDPQYALDLIDQARVRVVMSDIKMPGLDGLHFLEHALHHEPPPAYTHPYDRFYRSKRHCRHKTRRLDYIPKPVDRSRLKKISWTNYPTRSTAANAFALWSINFSNDLNSTGSS